MGILADGISGVKLQGSNPGSLLRSKSTRRDRRCEAASERLVYLNLNACSVASMPY